MGAAAKKDPSASAAAAVRMEPEDIIRQLSYVRRGQFPREALEAAIAQREEITPYLLAEVASSVEEVTDRCCAAPDKKSAYYLFDFSMLLLALFREPAAFKPILRFFAAPGREAHDLVGYLVTEDLCAILVRCYDGDLPALKALIENPAPDEFVRSAALGAIHGLMLTGVLSREEVVGYFEELLAGVGKEAVSDDDEAFKSWIVDHACDLREPCLKPVIEECFDDDLVDTTIVDRDDVEAIYRGESADVRRDRLRESVFADLIGYVGRWHWFSKESVRERLGLRRPRWELPANAENAERVLIDEAMTGGRGYSRLYNTTTFVRGESKTGRNDPCPCGSGKKYKKCCLDA